MRSSTDMESNVRSAQLGISKTTGGAKSGAKAKLNSAMKNILRIH